MKLKIDPVDCQIGARVRTYRLLRKLSQTDLADKLGVSFQQVQKYEKGSNRISGSRLTKIAEALAVEPAILFGSETGKTEKPASNELIALIDQADTLRLLTAFNRIKGRVRGAIVNLAEAYANAS